MGGILQRNLAEESILRNQNRYGVEIKVPPNDEALFVASTGLADNTADADFTLTTHFNTDLGGRLPWPCRVFVVLRNAGSSGPPGITQVNPSFQDVDADKLGIRITGSLGGKAIVEEMVITPATVTSPAGMQRVFQTSVNYFDRITAIRHINKAGAYGTTTPLQVSVGLGNGEFGDASGNRLQLRAPFRASTQFNSTLKRLIWLDDETSAPAGSGTGGSASVLIENNQTRLQVPGKAADYNVSAGLFTTDVTANTFTKTAHGLLLGNTVRLEPYGAALPGGVTVDTTYYLVTVNANDFQLAATMGGAAIDITGSNGTVRVYRPSRRWRRAVLVFDGEEYAESPV